VCCSCLVAAPIARPLFLNATGIFCLCFSPSLSPFPEKEIKRRICGCRVDQKNVFNYSDPSNITGFNDFKDPEEPEEQVKKQEDIRTEQALSGAPRTGFSWATLLLPSLASLMSSPSSGRVTTGSVLACFALLSELASQAHAQIIMDPVIYTVPGVPLYSGANTEWSYGMLLLEAMLFF